MAGMSFRLSHPQFASYPALSYHQVKDLEDEEPRILLFVGTSPLICRSGFVSQINILRIQPKLSNRQHESCFPLFCVQKGKEFLRDQKRKFYFEGMGGWVKSESLRLSILTLSPQTTETGVYVSPVYDSGTRAESGSDYEDELFGYQGEGVGGGGPAFEDAGLPSYQAGGVQDGGLLVTTHTGQVG